MKKTLILLMFLMLILQIDAQIVSDIEGNTYNTVLIGKQIWMKENLRTTRFNNGDSINTTIQVDKDVSDEPSPKYQWVYGNDNKLSPVYGRLYTWYVVTDDRNVCPTGWHVPSKEEFEKLIEYCGGNDKAGIKLKESGITYWKIHPDYKGTNESGFSAIPGGFRNYEKSGTYHGIDAGCYFWTSTGGNPFAIHIGMFFDAPNAFVSSLYHGNYQGFSVRCVNDSSLPESKLSEKREK